LKRLIPALLLTVFTISCVHSPSHLAAEGWKNFEKQRYQKAAKYFEEAEQRGYNPPKMRVALGASYVNLERYDEAIRELSAAAGNDPEAWFLLGNAYYYRDDYSKAADAYRKAISLKPDHLEAIEALAIIYPDGGVSREEALRLWKRALEMEKRDEWITRAQHYIEQLEKTQ